MPAKVNVAFSPRRVDVHIPSVETVGGFSMSSSPGAALRDRRLELAVKFSKHPPALWVHTQVQCYRPGGAKANLPSLQKGEEDCR